MTTRGWTVAGGALGALALLSQPAAATLPGENGKLAVLSGSDRLFVATSYLIAADLRAGTFLELFDESASHGLFSVSWQRL